MLGSTAGHAVAGARSSCGWRRTDVAMDAVKPGARGDPVRSADRRRRRRWDGARRRRRASAPRRRAPTSPTATADRGCDLAGRRSPPRGARRPVWRVEALDRPAAPSSRRPRRRTAGARRAVARDDRRLARWSTARSTTSTPCGWPTTARPGDAFLAAGAPWFLTLFGRDSLWAARMLLPLGTDLAAGTLRVLAGRQGRGRPAHRASSPARSCTSCAGRAARLRRRACACPPVYYGTVDATPLWVCLLHDAVALGPARRRGRAAAARTSRPRSPGWRDHGDADGDGLLEYVDATGRGLANQGWKDSGDSVQLRDGRLADRADRALRGAGRTRTRRRCDGAALLDAFGRPAATSWREWAAAPRGRASATRSGSRARPGATRRSRSTPTRSGRHGDEQHGSNALPLARPVRAC